MEHFQLKPDYKKISKYCTLPTSLEQLETYFADGYAITLNSYHNGKEFTFTSKHLEKVKAKFQSLIEEYRLIDVQDDILFILLRTYQSIDEANDYLGFSQPRKIQSKELAKLLLSFKTTPPNQLVSLTLKTTLKTGTAKITDQALMSWIYSVIQSQLEREQVHPGFMTPHDMELKSEDDLAWHANQDVPKPLKVPAIEYVMPLHNYLINETSFKPEFGKQLSNEMARFYFNLLAILEVIDPSQIDSEPEDYIQASFTNHLKRQRADM